ncbi:MAG: hypothetical protein OQJ83_09755 [Altibacter sp.]|nr:hypothetical protein [Altibacter sp.]
MKLIVVFTVLLILTKPLWPVAEYVMNYDFIVERLCENRDKPQLECNGKCYLSKQISKETEDSQQNPFGKSQSKDLLQQWVYLEAVPVFHFSNSLFTIKKSIDFAEQKSDSNHYGFVIPKPPEV